jgi:lipoprotein-releasing system ATP-binding protein
VSLQGQKAIRRSLVLSKSSGAEGSKLLEVTDLEKQYPTAQGPLIVLSGVSLRLARGEAIAIMGPSGSGKSTLLHILGALDPPTSGSVTLDGMNPYQLDQKAIARFRNSKIGFVFQDHCLLPQCSVIENVLTPTLVARARKDYTERARLVLDQVGLSGRLDHRPAELSGGEKQRVALARALINEPVLLLCDEPTGNLDRKSAEAVGSLLLDLHAGRQTILIVVTHSAELASKLPVQYEMTEQCIRRM